MLRFHTDHLTEAQARIDEAKALARLLITGRSVHDAFSALLEVELENLVERDPAHLFHDDLAPIRSLTVAARRVLDTLDPLAREQYLDFILCRRFRQTVLCHEHVLIDREAGAARVTTLFLAARGRVAVTPRQSDEVETATAADADKAGGTEALFLALLETLDETDPRRLTFDEVTASVADGSAGPHLRA